MSKKTHEDTLKRLGEILGRDMGLCGNVNTWGQRPTPYEFVGFELTEDFMPILERLSPEKRKSLNIIMNYFEIHARPLKIILEHRPPVSLYAFYSEIAWSHFMTVVIFGMLEVAVQQSDCKEYNGKYLAKERSMRSFLGKYLPIETRESIAKRYSLDESSSYFKENMNFEDVVEHMWQEIRSGFIHEAGFHSKGFEWTTFGGGMGTEHDPIRIKNDVPIQEWIQITWQAILNSYGYKGLVKHQKIERTST